jgi:uncharacterized membrane protein
MNYSELKDQALDLLRNRWTDPVLAVLVFFLVSGVIGLIPFASLLITGPMTLGYATYFLRFSRGEKPDMNLIFSGFKNFGNALGLSLLSSILIALGFLLLIVPGVILALGWSQAYRIMHDKPRIGIWESMQESWNMMNGHKMDLFLLSLSFIGWFFLCLLTLGIGLLWLGPYVSTTLSLFYNKISGNEENSMLKNFGENQ